MLDAGRLLERLRAVERTVHGIERIGGIAATPQGQRQATLDPPGRDPRDEVDEADLHGHRRLPREREVCLGTQSSLLPHGRGRSLIPVLRLWPSVDEFGRAAVPVGFLSCS